jgi:hypothetical protein
MTTGRKEKTMKRGVTVCLLFILVIILLPGCTVITGANPGGTIENEVPVTTEFSQMLGHIPYSLFEKYDIHYGNPGQARQLHGAVDVNSLEDLKQLTKEEQWNLSEALGETSNVFPDWGGKDEQVAELTGFSVFSFNRIILINNIPPHQSYIVLGNFNEGLIKGKLAELGYGKTNYGKYAYYGIRDDFEIDLNHPLSRVVLANMNRVAVLDNMLIISPVTKDITDILDTMDGKMPSVLNNAKCKAVAESMGEPLAATLTVPDRLISPPDIADQAQFVFTVPQSWGQLHTFGMAGLGWHAEGEKRYLDIVLYYNNKGNAEADGKEITKRMRSYSFSIWQPEGGVSLSDILKPGEYDVKATGGGWMLIISSEVTGKLRTGISTLIGGTGQPVRDLLFLTLEPEKYKSGE